MHKKFYSSHCFFFPVIKVAAKYAKKDRINSLDADIQKFHLLKISETFTILLWNIKNLKPMKKGKKYFFDKIFPKLQYRNCINFGL